MPQVPRQDEDLEDCVVCMEEPATVVLHPCKHCEMCAGCILEIMARDKLCPTCRRAIVSWTHQPPHARAAGPVLHQVPAHV